MSDASSIVPGVGLGGEVPEPEDPDERQRQLDAERERQEKVQDEQKDRSSKAKEFYSGKGGDDAEQTDTSAPDTDNTPSGTYSSTDTSGYRSTT